MRVGLVDELAPPDDVIPRAVAWTTDLLTRPSRAMAATRRLARRPLEAAFDTVTAALLDSIVDHWFSTETQAVMKALASKLGKRG